MIDIERTCHIGFTKGLILRLIYKEGTAEVMPDWTGTKEEAMATIRQDPREVFTGCDCELEPDGACTGRPRPAV